MPNRILPHLIIRREWSGFSGLGVTSNNSRFGGPFLPDVFTDARQSVEMAFGADLAADPATWVWTDITKFVQWDPGVNITIGYPNEAASLVPAKFTCDIRNDQPNGGDFTYGNPLGVHWPYIAENTPTRARLDLGSGPYDRFFGYATNWAPAWDVNEQYAIVKFQAHGIHRRNKQGTSPAKSAMRRSYDHGTVIPVAYWSLEGGSGSTVAYDLINNLPSSVGGFTGLSTDQAGATKFGVSSIGPGSDLVANISGGWNLDLNLPASTVATGTIALEFSMAFDKTVRTGTYAKCGIRHNVSAQARHLSWSVYVNDSGLIELQWLESDSSFALLAGPTTVYSAGSENIFDGNSRVFQLLLTTSGATNVAWTLYENDSQLSSGTITPSFSGAMNAAPYRSASFSTAPASDVAALGHVAVFTADPGRRRYTPLRAHSGEYPDARLVRLCSEEDIPLELIGTSDIPMGAQSNSAFLELLDECIQVDQGLLYDGLSAGYTYVARTEAYSRATDLTLNSTGEGDIIGPTTPDVDDQGRVNTYTASNPEGGEATFVQTDAASVLAVSQVGTYESSGQHRTYNDSDLYQIAAWIVSIGTVAGLRYPRLEFELAKPHASTKGQAWLGCRPLAHIVATGLNIGQSDPNADLVLRGWSERWNSKTWRVVANTAPYAPFAVTVLASDTGDTGEFIGWLDCDFCTVTSDIAAGASSVSITTQTGQVWTNPAVSTYADDVTNFYIALDGMKVKVTAIANATSPQTFTIQSADVLRAVPAGRQIRVWDPVIVGL